MRNGNVTYNMSKIQQIEYFDWKSRYIHRRYRIMNKHAYKIERYTESHFFGPDDGAFYILGEIERFMFRIRNKWLAYIKFITVWLEFLIYDRSLAVTEYFCATGRHPIYVRPVLNMALKESGRNICDFFYNLYTYFFCIFSSWFIIIYIDYFKLSGMWDDQCIVRLMSNWKGVVFHIWIR